MTDGIRARFRVHVRCEHCTRDTTKILDVPNVDDAPSDIEELLESAFLMSQSFVCRGCDTPIGIIASISQMQLPELASA